MKLASYKENGRFRPGILIGDRLVDTTAAVAAAGLGAEEVRSNREVVAAPEQERVAMAEAAADLADAGGEQVHELAGLQLGPPIVDPEKIICLGLNYREHSDEMELEVPSSPTLFPKFRNTLIGHGESIVLPAPAREVDYEGELAVVIGARAKNVSVGEALRYVGGYMALNDISARDLQMETTQWTAGKIPDTFAPCGPVLVTAEEIEDPHSLQIKTWLNGDLVQSDSTARMIFGIAETIAFIASLVTLEPGDVIATGTPAGVGYKRKPPLFLAAGDQVEVEIEGIGRLVNPVVNDGAPERGRSKGEE